MFTRDTYEYWIFRIGGIAAVLGSLMAGVGNLLHPITPRDDPGGVAHVIAESGQWTFIHMIIVLGTLFMLAGLVAIRHTAQGELPEALARLGVYAGIIGLTIGLIVVTLDGVAAKVLADRWALLSGAEKAIGLQMVTLNETLNFALAGLFNMTFAGVPFLFLGLAVALSNIFPRWLGWIAVAAGIFSIAGGLVQLFSGVPTTTSLILTIIGPTVISLWLLVMGIQLVRKTPHPARSNSSFASSND
jgi:hypothetical protein